MRRWTLLGVLAVSVLAACEEPTYSGIDIAQTDGDFEAQITADEIRLTHGRVMIVDARLRSSTDEQFDALNQGSLRSADPDILQVHWTVYNFGYALVGAGPGRTELEIVVDDEVQDTLAVTVVEAGS